MTSLHAYGSNNFHSKFLLSIKPKTNTIFPTNTPQPFGGGGEPKSRSNGEYRRDIFENRNFFFFAFYSENRSVNIFPQNRRTSITKRQFENSSSEFARKRNDRRRIFNKEKLENEYKKNKKNVKKREKGPLIFTYNNIYIATMTTFTFRSLLF